MSLVGWLPTIWMQVQIWHYIIILIRILVPDKVVWVQQVLFNTPMGMRSKGKYVLLYIVAVLLCCLNLWCVSVWFISAWVLGLCIYSKIWASQAEDSQGRPQVWEALRSALSQVAEANGNQSALEQKPRWTHFLQCQRRHSRSRMYKSLVAGQCRNNLVIW
jgi:hypothetical protein